MAAVATPLYVAPPAVEPVRYGLLSVSIVADDIDPHWQTGVQWESFSCEAASCMGVDCSAPAGSPKTPRNGETTVEVTPFAVYGSYQCSPVGRPWDEAQQRALTHLLTGEQRAVEGNVLTGACGNTPYLANYTDGLTPEQTVNLSPAATNGNDGVAVVAVDGFAILEGWLGENYGSVGVIHAPRAIAPYVEDYVHRQGSMMETSLGTLVAFGGGYDGANNTAPDGTATPPGEAWLYASGRPVIRRSEPFTYPEPQQAGGGLDKGLNDLTFLAERMYAVGWDCNAAAVRVLLTTP